MSSWIQIHLVVPCLPIKETTTNHLVLEKYSQLPNDVLE